MKNLFKIGEVSKLCDISIKTLRFYEEEKLIKPVEVDIYTGYRYYDKENVEKIYQIKALKELGYSLQEIRDFNENSFKFKTKEIKATIKDLKNKLDVISYLQIKKGEKKMKPFINDENAIGKWQYVASCISKDEYIRGDSFVDSDVLFKELYFLPKGEGYWVFKNWTKGEIYHFRGISYPYEIVENKLFLQIYNCDNEYLITLVYKKVDSKEYTEEEMRIKDDIDVPFVLDEKAIGFWQACDIVKYKDKEAYIPATRDNLFLKSISVSPNGDAILEMEKYIAKIKWTKGGIISPKEHTNSSYIIKEIDSEDYLIMDWKSGDYVYGGEIGCCYVFKKIK